MLVCEQCGEENPERARFCLNCGSPLEPKTQPPQTRKVVTILFSDVTGSTRLAEQHDPEPMRHVMSRYFETARRVLGRHGGTVEKFIGDAVMAVFGVPQVHEDDALRAVRAALELHEELAAVNVELERSYGLQLVLRTGISTGEVVVGGGETYATGDPVNVAARLEAAAAPGEILIGETTRWLVRDAVEVEPVEPLELRGKAAPVRAWRLRGIVAEAPLARRLDTPLVGRERELGLLREAYAGAVAGRTCRLVTVLGLAGIGKSRLVRELVASVETDARVLRGHCLPYGEGITYWPLAEIVRAAAGVGVGLGFDEARARLGALIAGSADAEPVVQRLSGAIGLGDDEGARPEEVAWAARMLVEALARERPLVLVLDDIHWAEAVFLDLVEHLAQRIDDVPVLIVCMARPELLESRPDWARGSTNADSILLEGLSDEESRLLIDRLLAQASLDPAVKPRIAAAADGVPLFVEEMLAMLLDAGERARDVAVPPTIHALLAARIDRLDRTERSILQTAAVLGQQFARGAAAELADAPVDGPLEALVRKQLLRPVRAVTNGEDNFRFRHLLIRDAAYAALSKEQRSELHERFADYLERSAGDRLREVEEIVAYHLEQAHGYLVELGSGSERVLELAARAAARLGAAGSRAYARTDMPAAANLLQRALALLGADAPERAALQVRLGLAFRELGRLAEAEEAFAAAESAGASNGDRVAELDAQVGRLLLRPQTDPTFDVVAGIAAADAAVRELERLGSDAALARAWHIAYWFRVFVLRFEEVEQAARQAFDHARRAGDAGVASEALYWLAIAIWWGPTPVHEALRRCEELLAQTVGPNEEASVLTSLAGLKAMAGEFAEAHELIDRAVQRFHQLGLVVLEHGLAFGVAQIQLHAGDPAAAERTLRASCAALDALGEKGYQSTQLSLLAAIVALIGDPEEALEIAERSRELTARGDVLWTAYWSSARARALARLGRHEEAEALVREAVDLVARSDDPHTLATLKGEAAAVLAMAGKTAGARQELEEALALHEAKGCIPCTERTRAQILALSV